MRRPQGTGTLLIASAVLSVGGYVVLGTQFGWPAVLDEPASRALDAFVESAVWVRFGFYLFLLSSLVLVPVAIGLHDHLDRRSTASASVWPSVFSAPSPRCLGGASRGAHPGLPPHTR